MSPASQGPRPEAIPFDGIVAIVDDDPSVRRALKRLLNSVGVRCVTHGSGLHFLESRELFEVDCLVLDVHMPRMTGMEVLEEIRVASTKLPIVLMTGRFDSDFAERAIAAGASAFLRKPFSDEQLFSAIGEATGRRVG